MKTSKLKQVLKTAIMSVSIMMLMVSTCFAADLKPGNATGSMQVVVDTTKTQANGGSLPNTFSYTVTVPATLILHADNQSMTALNVDETFSNNTNIVIKGIASVGKHIKVQVASTTVGDTSTTFTLKHTSDASKSSTDGQFYLKTAGNSSYEARSQQDATAMLSSAGLSIPLGVQGVKGIDTYGQYTGSLSFTVSEV